VTEPRRWRTQRSHGSEYTTRRLCQVVAVAVAGKSSVAPAGSRAIVAIRNRNPASEG
jgi:hypothetical protein